MSLLCDSIHKISLSIVRCSGYMQNMKKQTCLSLACCTGINLLLVLISVVQPANAGGGDMPIPANFVPRTDDQLTIQQLGARNKAQTFSWSLWSKHYLDGDRMCRQYNGDIVCFSPESSKQLNWKIQPFYSQSN